MSEDLVEIVLNSDQKKLLQNAFRFTGNLHDALDVVQDAYLKILQQKNTLTTKNLGGLMYRIIQNAAYDLHRRRRVRGNLNITTPDSVVADEPENPVYEELSEALARAMTSLPARYKSVLEDAAEGLTYKEIAAKHRIALGTAMSRLYRARRHMQRVLAPYQRMPVRDDVAA